MTEEHHYISHKTMVNLLNDLSPFNYAYFYGFFAVFFTSLILGRVPNWKKRIYLLK